MSLWHVMVLRKIKKRKAEEEMFKKKLRFVAMHLVRELGHYNSQAELEAKCREEADRAEQVFYADDVMYI